MPVGHFCFGLSVQQFLTGKVKNWDVNSEWSLALPSSFIISKLPLLQLLPFLPLGFRRLLSLDLL